MSNERTVRAFAGAVVLMSLALGVQPSPVFLSGRFLWITAFVGANLFQSALTGFCPLEMLLRRRSRVAGTPS